MEKELNIAAILKDKPNARIYDLLHNIYVKLDNISTTDKETVIWCTKEYPDKTSHFGYSELGTERGWLDGLQILKPSEEMQDWSKFAWKKGDVLVCKNDLPYTYTLFDHFTNDKYTEFYGKFHYSHEYCKDYGNTSGKTAIYKKISDELADKIISSLENTIGGKLNLSTLEIEHPKPEFKDGDIVYLNTKNGLEYVFAYDANKETLTSYIVAYCITLEEFVHIETQYICTDNRINSIHLATDSEKQQLFDALAKEGKAWDADKKMLVDLPKKCELKPFDKVLVRDTDAGIWMPTLFGFYDKEFCNYVCLNETFQKCIPYNDQTKHLIGTTGEWKGGEA